MPVLMMATGDPQAKGLLRSAIEARYGFRPPVLQTLKLGLKGRALSKIGPLSSWLGIEITTHFKFPLFLHWEYTVRVSGMAVRSGAEAYDGKVFRRRPADAKTALLSDPQLIGSIQRRLWAVGAVMLMPLTEQNVILKQTGEHLLEATNRNTADTVRLELGPDSALTAVELSCFNPQEEDVQMFRLTLSGGTTSFGDLNLPRKVTAYWNDEAYLELEPVMGELNPIITDRLFSLAR